MYMIQFLYRKEVFYVFAYRYRPQYQFSGQPYFGFLALLAQHQPPQIAALALILLYNYLSFAADAGVLGLSGAVRQCAFAKAGTDYGPHRRLSGSGFTAPAGRVALLVQSLLGSMDGSLNLRLNCILLGQPLTHKIIQYKADACNAPANGIA